VPYYRRAFKDKNQGWEGSVIIGESFGTLLRSVKGKWRFNFNFMDARKLLPNDWPKRRIPRLFRRMNDPYRVVFIDERTLDEVASYRLTRHGVYGFLSAVTLVGIGLLLALLLYTPLKYYIPGYGSGEVRSQALRLQQTVDSLQYLVATQQRQAASIQRLITGHMPPRDTALLDVEKLERERMQRVMPQAEEIKKKADIN
jgi:hypothetical protein